jgi:Spy/CpxP family protein refolding chaperone
MTPMRQRRGLVSGPGIAAVVLVLVAVACVLAGAAAERYTMLHRLGPLGSFLLHDDSPGGRERMRGHLKRDLNLTPAQQTRIDSIMANRVQQSQRLRVAIDSQLRTLILDTRAQIDSVLTPAQRQKFHEGIRKRGGDATHADATQPPPPR